MLGLKALEVCIELSIFIRQHISIRNEVKKGLAMFLLHLHNVLAQVIFPSNLITLREMINFLVFIQPFIEIAFASGVTP